MQNRTSFFTWRRTAALFVAVVALQAAASPAVADCPPTWVPGIGNPGMSQSVQCSIIFDDGTTDGPALYAGGAFLSAGGIDVERVARWNGQSWAELDKGFNGTVHDFATFDDGAGESLYAAGAFIRSGLVQVLRIGKWTGNEWVQVGTGLNATTHVLGTYDVGEGEKLYVGGSFTHDGTGNVLLRRIVTWDGAGWSEVGGGILGTGASVRALAVFDDGSGPALYVGGNFGFAGGNNPFNNIVRWDGTSWSALGEGVTGGNGDNVSAMAVFDDGSGPALYVGGQFTTAGGEPISGLARWDGESWSAVGGGISVGLLGVQDIVADQDNGKLYVTGSISSAGGESVTNIAVWDGESWSAILPGITGGTFPAGLTLSLGDLGDGPTLFVGGIFTTAGGMTANRIAELVLSVGPMIVEQPQDTVVDFGENVVFTVGADDAKEFQWRFNGIDLVDGSGVSGANTPVLQIESVTLNDEGIYDVVVSNECEATVSDAAELTVIPKLGDLNGDGVVNVLDLLILLENWGACDNPADCPADLNEDGVVNVLDLLILLENWG